MSDTHLQFSYTINNLPATTKDRTPTSAQILADAGFEPADDYLLIQRTPHGSRVVASDDILEIDGAGAEFFAFEGGSAFEFTVNGHSLFWGEETIDVTRIRTIGHVPNDHDLVWMRDQDQNEVLHDGTLFNLKQHGIEHLRTHKRAASPPVYKYFVSGVEYTTQHETLTGAQIVAMIPDWNPANSLVLEGAGSDPDEVIHPSTIVDLKGRDVAAQFAVVPPATFGAS
jgi:hypothetical protein